MPGMGLRAPAARTAVVGVPSGVCAGAESGGVSVGALEATRTAELVSRQLRRAELPRPPGAASYAPPAHVGLRLLATGGAISADVISGAAHAIIPPQMLLDSQVDSRNFCPFTAADRFSRPPPSS